MSKIYFCPRCHRKMEIPTWILNGKVKAPNGVNIGCGNCKKGKIKVFPEFKEEKQEVTV